ncbi:unnamed protein product [Blepharisma stoltei]|uniref:Secreted protein n=1 Tax=Blepharisma stoltei TaxID=1481888 RepID=A0AAU9I6F1_9CILI|nr:unnamed protein product [Blepharisma stoltei]
MWFPRFAAKWLYTMVGPVLFSCKTITFFQPKVIQKFTMTVAIYRLSLETLINSGKFALLVSGSVFKARKEAIFPVMITPKKLARKPTPSWSFSAPKHFKL